MEQLLAALTPSDSTSAFIGFLGSVVGLVLPLLGWVVKLRSDKKRTEAMGEQTRRQLFDEAETLHSRIGTLEQTCPDEFLARIRSQDEETVYEESDEFIRRLRPALVPAFMSIAGHDRAVGPYAATLRSAHWAAMGAAGAEAQDGEATALEEELREAVIGAEKREIETAMTGITDAVELNRLERQRFKEGKYEISEALASRFLDVIVQMHGPEHENTAIALNNLAESYRAQGRYAEAEPLTRRALEIGETALGADHPDVATWHNNLAALLRAAGRVDEAEPLFRRALEIRETALGEEHTHYAQSLNNLAGLLRATGRYEEAEPLYRRALEIGETALGPDHPDVAIRLNNLAALLEATGRLEEAGPLLDRAIEIRRKVLGEDHPDFGLSIWWRAVFRAKHGDQDNAAKDFERAVAIFRKALGEDHPDTKQVIANYEKFQTARDE